MTWVDYFRTALALLIIVGLMAGVLYLGHLTDPFRVRVSYRAGEIEVTPSRALQVRPEAELPEPAAWHAAVLFCLSPELRGEFANSPDFTNKYEPSGSYSMRTLQGVLSVDELRRGFEAPSVQGG